MFVEKKSKIGKLKISIQNKIKKIFFLSDKIKNKPKKKILKIIFLFKQTSKASI